MAQVLHVQSNTVLLKTRHYFVIYHHVYLRFVLTKQYTKVWQLQL